MFELWVMFLTHSSSRRTHAASFIGTYSSTEYKQRLVPGSTPSMPVVLVRCIISHERELYVLVRTYSKYDSVRQASAH